MAAETACKNSIDNVLLSFLFPQVDEFKIRGLELGKLKEMVISHKEQGRGRGWFCDRVVVKSTLSSMLKVFPCNRWLDTGCEDRQLVRHLKPLGQMPVSSPPIAGKSSKYRFYEIITHHGEIVIQRSCGYTLLTKN